MRVNQHQQQVKSSLACLVNGNLSYASAKVVGRREARKAQFNLVTTNALEDDLYCIIAELD